MFNSIINALKATTDDQHELNKAQEALAERMDHMMRMESLSARICKLEVKTPVKVKEPRAILLKKNYSLRRAFAA